MPKYREIKDTSNFESFSRMRRLMHAITSQPIAHKPMHDMSKRWIKRGWKEITRNQHMLLFYDGKYPLPKAYIAKKDVLDPFMWEAPLDGYWVAELRKMVGNGKIPNRRKR